MHECKSVKLEFTKPEGVNILSSISHYLNGFNKTFLRKSNVQLYIYIACRFSWSNYRYSAV